MTKKTIEVFKPGRHVATNGQVYEFSAEDCAALAAAYDPLTFSAPAVVGHPRADSPAYGWATAMRQREDGIVVADLEKVCPQFAEAVEAGHYAKVSLALYGPEDKGNPSPGAYYPRHIGFLGGAAPGVKGLAPVAFAEGDDEYIEFASNEDLRPLVWFARNVGSVLGRIRDWMIDKEGLEAADKMIPSWEVDSLAETAAKLDANLPGDGLVRGFAEGEATGADGGAVEPGAETPAADTGAGDGGDAAAPPKADDATEADPTADRAAELDAREARLAEREQAQTARDADAAQAAFAERRAEDGLVIQALVTGGRLSPGLAPVVLGFCEALDGAEAIAFAEGEVAEDPRARFHAFLQQHLGQAVPLDEAAPSSGAAFAEGATAEDMAAAIDAEMSAAAEAGQPIGSAEAARRAKSRFS